MLVIYIIEVRFICFSYFGDFLLNFGGWLWCGNFSFSHWPLILQEILSEIVHVSLWKVKDIGWVIILSFWRSIRISSLSEKGFLWHSLFNTLRQLILLCIRWRIADTTISASHRLTSKLGLNFFHFYRLILFLFTLKFLQELRFGLFKWIITLSNALISSLISIIITFLLCFVIIGNFNNDVEGYSLLRVQAESILLWDSQHSMHSILAHFLSAHFQFTISFRWAISWVRQICRFLSDRNINIRRQIFINFLNNRL